MTELLLGLLILVPLARILWAMLAPDRFYEFPTLCAFVYAGFIVPRAIAIYQRRFDLPLGSVDRMMLLAILSLVAIIYFFNGTVSRSKRPPKPSTYDAGFLVWCALGAVVIGLTFFFLLYRMGIDTRQQTWTGLPVVYLYFGNLFFYGFALLLILGLRTRDRTIVAVASACGVLAVLRVLIVFRRSELLELMIVVAYALYFVRHWRVPRVIVLGAAVAVPVVIASAHEYRYAVQSKRGLDFGASTQIDYVGNFWKKTFGGSKTEVENAAVRMAAVAKTGRYSLGLHYWNDFVHSVVPSTLLGGEFKRSLFLSLVLPDILAQRIFGYYGKPGVTNTGFLDAYWAFGYAGAVIFGVIALVMRFCYVRAIRGDIAFQFYFLVLTVDALHAITHSTSFFVFHAFHAFAMTGWAFWYAKHRAKTLLRLSTAAPRRYTGVLSS